MAVKMRLRREGKKKQPFYRVVVADARSPRDGRFIEDIGYYQPLHDPSTISIDRDRALHWLRTGVQPTEAVVKLLRIEGIWEEFRPGDPGRDRTAKNEARAAQAEEKRKRANTPAKVRAVEAAPEAEAAPAAEEAEAPADEAPAAEAAAEDAPAAEAAAEEAPEAAADAEAATEETES